VPDQVTDAQTAGDKVQALLESLDRDECHRLIGDNNREYRTVSEAVMAWQAMLFAGLEGRGVVLEGSDKLMGSSMVVLGTIVQFAYALGIRRGQRRAQRKKRSCRKSR